MAPTPGGAAGLNAYVSVVAADVNGDGRADLLATKADGTLWYFQNNGTTTPYQTPVQLSPTNIQTTRPCSPAT